MSPQLPEPSGLLVYGFLTIQLTMAVGLLYCIVRTSGTKALPKAAALLVAGWDSPLDSPQQAC
jgi:hypothetical protein